MATSPLSTRSRRGRARIATASAGIALAALGLAGCAATSSTSSSAAASAAAEGGVAPQPAYAGADTALGSTASGIVERTADQPLAVTPDRAVVVNADSAVRVTDVTKATAQLGVLAARYTATVDNQVSSRGTAGPLPMPTYDEKVCSQNGSCPMPSPTGYESSTTTLRLDNDKVDALLRDVATLGTVESSARSSADVTAEVADVEARLRTAQASLVRVRALMGKATSIGDIVALEGELSRRQADLEAMQARQRTLADQTAQATVTVRLYGDDAPAPMQEQSGFLAGLTAGWAAFTGALVVALTVVGAVLPFVILLGPLALLVWVGVRRSRRIPTTTESGATG